MKAAPDRQTPAPRQVIHRGLRPGPGWPGAGPRAAWGHDRGLGRLHPVHLTVNVLRLLLPAHTPQDHTLENGVRLGVAGMVLLILVAILAEAGHGQGRFQCRPQEWRPKGAPQRD